MDLWIDIDNPRHIPITALLIGECKTRGHNVTLTISKSGGIKKALDEYNLNVKDIGFLFSFFGIIFEPFYLFRAALLVDYIEPRKIDVAFSLGSKSLLFTCTKAKIPVILYLSDYKNIPHYLHLALDKSFFIIPEGIQEQKLIEKKYDLNKVARTRYNIDVTSPSPDPRSIVEIVDKIEILGKHIPGGLTA